MLKWRKIVLEATNCQWTASFLEKMTSVLSILVAEVILLGNVVRSSPESALQLQSVSLASQRIFSQDP